MKHIVGFSGGIDSQAALRWARNRFGDEDVIALNCDAGHNESIFTVAFIRRFSETVFPVAHCFAIPADMNTPPFTRDAWAERRCYELLGMSPESELTFELMIRAKDRAPSSQRRFCTSILKLMPQRRWCMENLKGVEFELYTGVRRDESEGRKNTSFRVWDDVFDTWQNNVLADWTKKMCFEFVTAHGEEYNPMYKMNFSRVGCAPCILWAKEDILAWAEQCPEGPDKIRGYERTSGKTYFAPIVPGMKINFIDDVLAWARTSHGGRQFRILPERSACESQYGLCE
jgi:3'-phosphoadenosine 5'-phosphosulfate sulfotransferase (PAPS reductase)/FAD synthetase